MLHLQVLTDLLTEEARLARDLLGQQAADLSVDPPFLRMTLRRPDGDWLLRMDGSRYDAEPFGVTLVNEQDEPLEIEQWPPGLAANVHPVVHRPWICITGVAEYYTYPGHHADRWDHIRSSKRADRLLQQLLAKAGAR